MDTIDPAAKHSQVNINTLKNVANLNTTIQLPNAWVDSVSILFAPGHAALTGVRLQYAGNTILPWEGIGGYILGDNERLNFDVGMYLPGVITIGTRNTDSLAHGHTVIFHWHTWKSGADVTNAPLPLVVA